MGDAYHFKALQLRIDCHRAAGPNQHRARPRRLTNFVPNARIELESRDLNAKKGIAK